MCAASVCQFKKTETISTFRVPLAQPLSLFWGRPSPLNRYTAALTRGILVTQARYRQRYREQIANNAQAHLVEPNPQIDQIGYWSEIKLDIIKEYATAYSTILSARTSSPFTHVYIEGFAGAGLHLSNRTEELVPRESPERTPGQATVSCVSLDRHPARQSADAATTDR